MRFDGPWLICSLGHPASKLSAGPDRANGVRSAKNAPYWDNVAAPDGCYIPASEELNKRHRRRRHFDFAPTTRQNYDAFVEHPSHPMMPFPPHAPAFHDVVLKFARLIPGDPTRGMVPAYHFRILIADGTDVGHINFRIGDTPHVRLCAGHIGFAIQEAFRGHKYAEQACRALAPFVRSVYSVVTITCDPDNLASRRTIERLEAQFIDEVAVPPNDPQFERGSRWKRRYQWTP